MALAGQIQYFPVKHLVGAGIIFLLLVLASLWPTDSGTRQQSYVIELPEISDSIPEQPEPDWEEATVQSGDSLSSLFSRESLSAVDVINIAAAVPREAITVKPGQKIRWTRTADNHIVTMELEISPLANHIISRSADGTFSYELSERVADYVPRFASATINSSLLYDGAQAGIPTQILYQMITLYGWDIDFALDLRKGDTFSLIYEEVQLEGEKIGYGNILITRFNNRGRELTALRYEDPSGNDGYYTPEGSSMRKAFLRNPIDFARISSRFNLNRRHPVLNTIRAHRGTDYAAPTGTPIKTTGDGKVVFAGRQNGFGNVVIIQHGSRYRTKYAHMSKFGKGIRSGKYVKQGQVIGYVGMTGLATGPHLHFEFLVDGVHRDSLRVDLPKAESVSSKDRADFSLVSKKLTNWLDNFEALNTAGLQ